MSDLHPQGGTHTGGEDPWQGGCEQASQGSMCFFVGGGRLTSLAHELGSTPCSIAAFTIYHFLARSLVTFNCRISCFGDSGWERDQRVRLHCVFSWPRSADWASHTMEGSPDRLTWWVATAASRCACYSIVGIFFHWD